MLFLVYAIVMSILAFIIATTTLIIFTYKDGPCPNDCLVPVITIFAVYVILGFISIPMTIIGGFVFGLMKLIEFSVAKIKK